MTFPPLHQSTAHQMLESFLGLGVDRELYAPPVTWYLQEDLHHGWEHCVRYRSLQPMEETSPATPVEVSILDLSPEDTCSRCDAHAMHRYEEIHIPAACLLALHREAQEELPEDAQGLLRRREKLSQENFLAETGQESPHVRHLLVAHLECMARQRDTAHERFFSEDATVELRQMVESELDYDEDDDQWRALVVEGKFFPSLARLDAALVERFRVAALSPEAGLYSDDTPGTPLYLLHAPLWAIRYFTESSSLRRKVRLGPEPITVTDRSVLQTALELWDPTSDSLVADLENAIEIAGLV